MGTISKITIKQIKDILRDKIERTLSHSKHTFVDTNTFIESEVKDQIEEINDEERILKTQIEQNFDGVLEHIEQEITRILKSKDLSIDTKSLEFKELRKQFLELRLVRSNGLMTSMILVFQMTPRFNIPMWMGNYSSRRIISL